jgi:hypothetical protein
MKTIKKYVEWQEPGDVSTVNDVTLFLQKRDNDSLVIHGEI